MQPGLQCKQPVRKHATGAQAPVVPTSGPPSGRQEEESGRQAGREGQWTGCTGKGVCARQQDVAAQREVDVKGADARQVGLPGLDGARHGDAAVGAERGAEARVAAAQGHAQARQHVLRACTCWFGPTSALSRLFHCRHHAPPTPCT